MRNRSINRSIKQLSNQSFSSTISIVKKCSLKYFITFEDLSRAEMPRKYGKTIRLYVLLHHGDSSLSGKASVPPNRKQSYDCVIISFVIRLCMQIM